MYARMCVVHTCHYVHVHVLECVWVHNVTMCMLEYVCGYTHATVYMCVRMCVLHSQLCACVWCTHATVRMCVLEYVWMHTCHCAQLYAEVRG